jgi:hypothetical protein
MMFHNETLPPMTLLIGSFFSTRTMCSFAPYARTFSARHKSTTIAGQIVTRRIDNSFFREFRPLHRAPLRSSRTAEASSYSIFQLPSFSREMSEVGKGYFKKGISLNRVRELMHRLQGNVYRCRFTRHLARALLRREFCRFLGLGSGAERKRGRGGHKLFKPIGPQFAV